MPREYEGGAGRRILRLPYAKGKDPVSVGGVLEGALLDIPVMEGREARRLGQGEDGVPEVSVFSGEGLPQDALDQGVEFGACPGRVRGEGSQTISWTRALSSISSERKKGSTESLSPISLNSSEWRPSAS